MSFYEKFERHIAKEQKRTNKVTIMTGKEKLISEKKLIPEVAARALPFRHPLMQVLLKRQPMWHCVEIAGEWALN